MEITVEETACGGTHSGLDLFSELPLQTEIESGCWERYEPLGSLDHDAPVEFFVPGNTPDFIDFGMSYLHVQGKIVDDKGNNLAPGVKIAPVNNVLHSLWSRIQLQMNGLTLGESGFKYPYKSFLDTELTFGSAVKKSKFLKKI